MTMSSRPVAPLGASSHTPLILVATLAVTMMLGPFSMDTYLPAFPAMAKALSVSQAAISLSVSAYVFATAFSQLLGGALSDRLGRQPVLMGGLVIFAGACIWLALSNSLNELLAGRALQALGAGFVLVSVPALVRDRVSGPEGARLFAMIGMMIVLAPGFAPSIGGLLLELGGWRAIFVFLGVYALALIPLLRRTIFSARYSVQPHRAEGKRPSLLQQYKQVLAVRDARLFIFWQAFAFSALALFITYASTIYQIHFQQSAHMFGLLFGANVVVMFLLNLLNRALLSKVRSVVILRISSILQGVGGVLMVIAAIFHWPLHWFVPTVMLTIGLMAMITPNMQACFMEFFPRNGGTAAALLGAMQFLTAGTISAVSSLMPQSLIAICMAIAACALIGAAMAVQSWRRGV